MRVLPPLLLSAALTAACARSSSAPLAIPLGDRGRCAPHGARHRRRALDCLSAQRPPILPATLGRFVRRTDAPGRPVADATQVLPPPGELTTYGPLSLWTDPATRAHAALSSTEGGGCASAADPTRPTPRGRGY